VGNMDATCSNKTGQVYASSDDAWGNVTSRTSSGTTATLTYDLLDHLIKWYASSTNQEQYVYDANGERVLRRSTTSSGTTMTVYAFGLEEHSYTGSGTLLSSTYYYSLAGRLIGALDASGTTFYLTDALGSLLASFSNTANSAALKSNQLYGPYGNTRYTSGTLNTAKGFTGQYNDSLTGLDYYGARYYDPVAGVFLSADAVAGNGAGMNPYAYVGGNPETQSDPSGLAAVSPCFAICGGPEHYPSPPVSSGGSGLLAKAVAWATGTSTPSVSATVFSGLTQSNQQTGACLVAGCRSGIFADTGSSLMQGPTVSTCLATPLGPCVMVPQPTFYRVNNPPMMLTYCTPPYGCGDGGSSESEGTRYNDLLFLSGTEGTSRPRSIQICWSLLKSKPQEMQLN
jgi:RHS repeat-associated protein